MPISRLDHFTLRTKQLAETRSFFENVAGLLAGPRPAFGFEGVWLYQGGVAVVHLAAFNPSDRELRRYLGARNPNEGSGSIDHIAFRCTDLPEFEGRLAKLGVPYTPRTVPELREHQVFVSDPNGVRIEFIFGSGERASWITDATGVAVPA